MILSTRRRDEVPATHLDLVECPPVAALTTLAADGSPQTSVVWCDDGEFVRVNTMRGFQKERNMRRNPKVTLLCYDPREQLRYLEIRGLVADMAQEGAAAHLDSLASKYLSRPVHYFGDVVCAELTESDLHICAELQVVRALLDDE